MYPCLSNTATTSEAALSLMVLVQVQAASYDECMNNLRIDPAQNSYQTQPGFRSAAQNVSSVSPASLLADPELSTPHTPPNHLQLETSTSLLTAGIPHTNPGPSAYQGRPAPPSQAHLLDLKGPLDLALRILGLGQRLLQTARHRVFFWV